MDPSTTSSTQITGELYEVDGATIALLDRMEGHPDVYCRTTVTLKNYSESVEMYILVNRAIKRTLQNYGHLSRRFIEVPSGDWNSTAFSYGSPSS